MSDVPIPFVDANDIAEVAVTVLLDDQSDTGLSCVHCIAVLGHNTLQWMQLSGYNMLQSKEIIISFSASGGPWNFQSSISGFLKCTSALSLALIIKILLYKFFLRSHYTIAICLHHFVIIFTSSFNSTHLKIIPRST